MARKRRRFSYFRPLVDFSSWMGLKSLRESGAGIAKSFSDLRQIQAPTRQETFAEAMVRLELDEDSLSKRRRQCLLSGWLYLSLSSALFLYSIYLLIHVHLVSTMVAIVLTAFLGVSAYREAFWYYQMTVRKLGCTFNEFFAFITGRR